MPTIPLDLIDVPDRQRRSIDRSPLQELKDSIIEHGLLHPILVMKKGDGRYRLVIGGRRRQAIEELHKASVPIHYSIGPALENGKIPCTVISERDLPALLGMELAENVDRVDLTWQERNEAISEIFEAKKQADPSFKQKELAIEIAEKTNSTVGTAAKQISRSLSIAAAIKDRPDLHKARSEEEAYQIILRERQEALETELTKRKMARAKKDTLLWTLRHGDAKEILLDLPDGQVDLVLVDPPYGQNIDKEKFPSGVTHRYDDSESYARDLSIFIIQESWRLTKNSANLFMFCSWKAFPILEEAAAQYGWSPWYHPIIWNKGTNLPGHSPWGSKGFRHDYEIMLYATKGQRGIKGPLSDVQSFDRVASKNKVHGAEKPLPLLEFLVEVGSYPHDLILDPCVGSGSSILAATKKHRRSIGIERDELYFNRAMSRMSNFAEGKPDVAAIIEENEDGQES